MTHIDPLRQRLLAIVEPVCADAGCEVVDLRLKSEPGGWVLRVYVDVAPEPGVPLDPEWWKHGVDIAVCERLSRELSAVLDVEDPVPHGYSLEVSSPGIDRPLRTPDHFRRFVGADVKVALAVPQGDRRNFKGRLTAVEPADAADPADPHAVVEVDGQPHRLRIADVDTARLVPDWDAVMKGQSGVGPRPANGAGAPGGHNSKKSRPRRAPEHR